MALRTITASGNLSASGFVNGDTIQVNDGVTLTWDVTGAVVGDGTGIAMTLGNNSGAGNILIDVLHPATILGHVSCNADAGHWACVDIAADAGLQFGGPAGFQPIVFAAYGRGPIRFRSNGTAGHPAYIRTDPAKPDAEKLIFGISLYPDSWSEWPTITSSIGIVGTYLDVTDVGNTSRYGVLCGLLWRSPGNSTRPVLDHCTFTRASLRVTADATEADGATAGLILRDCTFAATPVTTYLDGGSLPNGVHLDGLASDSTPRVELLRVGFDCPVSLKGIVSQDAVVYAGSHYGTGAFSGTYANIFVKARDGNTPVILPDNVTASGCYICNDATANAHTAQPGANSRITGGVLDAPLSTATTGDQLITATGSGTVEIDHMVVPPAAAATVGSSLMSPGKLLSNLGYSGTAVNFHHNTGCVQGSEGGFAGIGENAGNDYAGLLPYYRDNLAWSDGTNPATADVHIWDNQGASATLDAVGTADYNWGWNLVTGSNNLISTSTPSTRTGYRGVHISGSVLGDHDQSGDPQLADPTRNFIRWWREQVGATDPAYAAGQSLATDFGKAANWLRLHPDQVATLVTWVRAGAVPHAAATATADHTGGQVGAMAYAPAATIRCPVTITEADAGYQVPDLTAAHVFDNGIWWQEYARDITADPLDPRSDEWIEMLNSVANGYAHSPATVHPDGYYTGPGGYFYTTPFDVRDQTVRRITCDGRQRDESNNVVATVNQAWPLPADPVIDGGSAHDYYTTMPDGGDHPYHLIILDSAGHASEYWAWYNLTVVKDGGGNITSIDYRGYHKIDIASGQVPADQAAVVTAGGNPYAPLCFTTPELLAGEIKHALRVCVNINYLVNSYAWPALNHSSGYNPAGFPEGTRLRLKASKLADVLARFAAYDQANGKPTGDGTGHAWVIAQCLAKYGMIVDDVTFGWTLQIQGSVDSRTDRDLPYKLPLLTATDFEVVRTRQAVAFSGPTVVDIGQSANYTATTSFPTGVSYGNVFYFYGTNGLPTGVGYNDWAVSHDTPVKTSAASFAQVGTYTVQPTRSLWAWWYYDPPFTVTARDPAAGTATAYTLTLTGGGQVRQAITATVVPNGNFQGTVTLTPSGGGLTTPVVLTFPGDNRTLTATFTPTASGTLAVTGTNSGTLTNPAAASTTIARLDLIDDADPAATFVGNWVVGHATSDVFYGTDYHYHQNTATAGDATASYAFSGLTAAHTYRAYITWATEPNRATDVPWQVLDSNGTTVLASGTVDQSVAPAGIDHAGVSWTHLADIQPTGTTVTVRVLSSDQGPGTTYTIADAAYLADGATTHYVFRTATTALVLRSI